MCVIYYVTNVWLTSKAIVMGQQWHRIMHSLGSGKSLFYHLWKLREKAQMLVTYAVRPKDVLNSPFVFWGPMKMRVSNIMQRCCELKKKSM
jgi:hypothetical protein